ncbi:hypothetical protein TWF225_005457 [Orbilia oligospora]|nr:hypothetical protein TWF225_005457 [Orbilia oligospora]KAF3259914.1 hypothetical protein TWF128_003902 [Orbilia oligospora]KAF3270780.1 hypothetical protein TWF217_007055 [Orbilia oligospora]
MLSPVLIAGAATSFNDWAPSLLLTYIIVPASAKLADSYRRLRYHTVIEEQIHLQELREAGHAVKMPPGYYTVDYTPASASLKDEEVELEFENAFRKMRYTWREGQDSELLQNGKKAYDKHSRS